MRRLVCACVICKPGKTGFLASRPIYDALGVFFNCKYFLLQVGEVVVVEVEDVVVEDVEVGVAMVVKFREAGVIVPVVMLVVTGIKVVVVMEVVEADHSQLVVTKEVVVVTKEVDTRVVEEEVIKVAEEEVIKVAEEVIKVEEAINRVMIKEDIRTVMVVEEGVGEGEGVGGEAEVAEDERSDDTSRLPDKRGGFLINFLIPQPNHMLLVLLRTISVRMFF